MAKKSKSCKIQSIVVKKKGRKTPVAKFDGRPGGSELCGKRRPSSAQQKSRKAFARAAKVCRLHKGYQRDACFNDELGRSRR